MDINKAQEIAILVAQRNSYEQAAKDFQAAYNKCPDGTTEVTVPRKWLPVLKQLAEGEMNLLDAQLTKL
jgi:hypothetical protein